MDNSLRRREASFDSVASHWYQDSIWIPESPLAPHETTQQWMIDAAQLEYTHLLKE
jgi:hypothetical protein